MGIAGWCLVMVRTNLSRRATALPPDSFSERFLSQGGFTTAVMTLNSFLVSYYLFNFIIIFCFGLFFFFNNFILCAMV